MSGAVFTAAGASLQASAQIQQGEAQRVSANFKAGVAEQNAALATQSAAENERRFRITARKQIGKQRAAIGASGVTLEGSPLDVLEESAANAELDALTIRHGGKLSARGFINDATILRFGGEVAASVGRLKASGILFTAAGDIISSLPTGGGG